MDLNSKSSLFENAKKGDRRSLAKLLTRIENDEEFDIPATETLGFWCDRPTGCG